MTNRRGFLSSIIALGVAPAVCRASNLMHVRPILPVDESRLVTINGVYFGGRKDKFFPLDSMHPVEINVPLGKAYINDFYIGDVVSIQYRLTKAM